VKLTKAEKARHKILRELDYQEHDPTICGYRYRDEILCWRCAFETVRKSEDVIEPEPIYDTYGRDDTAEFDVCVHCDDCAVYLFGQCERPWETGCRCVEHCGYSA
jgi:hypothetical protein